MTMHMQFDKTSSIPSQDENNARLARMFYDLEDAKKVAIRAQNNRERARKRLNEAESDVEEALENVRKVSQNIEDATGGPIGWF